MAIGIIVEFELVDITDHDAKGLAKILFKIFPQCFAVQKARELVIPKSGVLAEQETGWTPTQLSEAVSA